jgi:hypothetical protein
MATLSEEYVRMPNLDLPPATEAELRAEVRGALAMMCPAAPVADHRRQKRFPFPHVVYLTPVAEDGLTPLAGTLVAAGKHLSQSGMGFYHPDPLPYRLVIASLPRPEGGWLGVLLELRWCRFIRHGWYESGGRFVRVVPAPLPAALAGLIGECA